MTVTQARPVTPGAQYIMFNLRQINKLCPSRQQDILGNWLVWSSSASYELALSVKGSQNDGRAQWNSGVGIPVKESRGQQSWMR